jgi:hypothetical protein
MDSPLPEGLVAEWQRFFTEDRPTIKVLDTIFEPIFKSPILFPLQRKAELKKMLDHSFRSTFGAGVNKPIVMEIGADKAGGFYHFVEVLRPAMAICLEIRGVPYAELFRKEYPETQFLFQDGSSYSPEVVSLVEQFLAGRMIDVLFIDGDKSMFLKDFELYVRYVRPGGVVFMHDVTDEAPGRAFDAAKKHPWVKKVTTILDVSDYEAERIREAAGEPERNPYEGWLRHWKGRSCGVGVLLV